MRFSSYNVYAVVVYGAVRFCAAQVYEGVRTPIYPPIEIFGGSPVTRFRWTEQSEERQGLCLIDWSLPDTTLQPFGTHGCPEPGAPPDMGAQWLLSTKFDNTQNDSSVHFEGLVGNMGTGRCMEWKPAPANQTPQFSAFSDTTTYGTLTSEICDLENQYQYFRLDNWRNSSSTLNFLPKMWNETCPEGQEPTMIAGPKRSLVAYGCGKGLWQSYPIIALFGWWYYDAIQEKAYRIEVGSDRYQTILCCQRQEIFESSFCTEAMRKEGQGDRTPQAFWDQMCTEIFPNYPEFKKARSGKD
ncbi:hypothetical protein TWF718_008121 [Orbilia javanica]|uniref:Uncharacterized protein n=1 Tax=Orbilia javanica TaxID=47235 RepID=A0AAN8RC72_9PEZI